MAKYVLFYIGGSAPGTSEEGKKTMEAWMAWFSHTGVHVVDPGAPFGPRKVVGGTTGAGAMGYTIVAADTMDAALKLTENHPHLAVGGSIEVCEAAPIAT
jgi:hypothetical protein